MELINFPIQLNDLKREYQLIKQEIDHAINDCIKKTSFIGGQTVTEFEKEFANLIGKKHCISCGNGTDALYIALKNYDLNPNDEVIVPALTWISSSETVTQAGGKPVFADIETGNWVLTVDNIKKVVNKKTKGIVLVHLYGKLANLSEILKFAKENNLFVIEDCAQSHLAKSDKNINIGSDISTYSFFPGKNLGAYGDGGAIATDNDKFAEFCRLYARHGAFKKGEHLIEGINSRLDTIQASILRVKLKYLVENTKKRISIADSYYEQLVKVNEINIPNKTEGFSHVFHLYVINTERRDELKEFLLKKKIFTNINYPKALPDQICYEKKFNNVCDTYKVSRYLAKTCLSLPMHPFLKAEEVEYISENIKNFFK